MLPPELLQAISDPVGGRVVIVTGAGCSVEPPTNLPLSAACSAEAHRRLRADGVLAVDCAAPWDLSCVADAVFEARGSQDALVQRLPRESFRTAQPNVGHLIAAALLRERTISCVLTLNFDLAFSTALAMVGAGADVATIPGPEHHRDLATVNLIYLHRNVDAVPDAWILRTAALEDEWRNAWEEVIARRVLTGPVTVFAGLGSACGVLTESARRVKDAVPAGTLVFQVDPGTLAQSKFAEALGIAPEAYVQNSWVPFMKELAARVLIEHQARIGEACERLLREKEWPPEDVPSLIERLGGMGFLNLGRLRARWLLEDAEYAPNGTLEAAWLADLLLCVGLMERVTGTQAFLIDDGVVEFWRDREHLGSAVVGHGRGTRSLAVLEAKLDTQRMRHPRRVNPRFALVSGFTAGLITTPRDIVGDVGPGDIVASGATRLELISCDDLRQDPRLIHRLVA